MTDADAYPVLPLKDLVVFPQVVHHLAVGRRKSLAALAAAAEGNRELVGVAQRKPGIEDPDRDDLHAIGTVMKIIRIDHQDKGAQVIVQGVRRVALAETLTGMMARIRDGVERSREFQTRLARELRSPLLGLQREIAKLAEHEDLSSPGRQRLQRALEESSIVPSSPALASPLPSLARLDRLLARASRRQR